MLQNETLEAQDFAKMLEESFKILHTGETVTGTIVSISDKGIYVDLGTKSTGVIPTSELSEDADLKVGDEITARVVKLNDQDGQTTLSKKAVDKDKDWTLIENAKENDEALTGKVVKVIKGGLILSVGTSDLFVPASQSGIAKDGDLNVLLGTEQQVKVIDIDARRHRAVASIRAIQRMERKEQREAFWASLEEGKEFTGTVKSLTSYGAFVDLGGMDGMIHVSELSWKRIKHPSEVVSVGDTVTVFVKSFDREAERVSLGYKTEATNPWTIFTTNYHVDDVVSAKIVSLTTYGAFAEVIDGVDGLIHISQIANRKIATPADVLKVGDVVDAKIIEINEDSHRISLSIRALLPEEEVAEEATETVEAVEENA
jgi:4-hydroxy-3-methylbut-2-enyl diphosphate reductase